MQEQEKLMQQLKDAFVAIKKLKADLQNERYKQNEPIAIVGMAMRFPGNILNAEDYWQMLQQGDDVINDIPEDRFDVEALYDENPEAKGKIKVKQGGFLADIDKFDGSFYDITPVELESLDPQQRLLLEVTHEALENAGIDIKGLKNSATGVYCGVTNVDYQKKHFRSGDYTLINNYAYTGTAVCAHAGRISYLLGLQGPSMSIDTACSSSLVATHLAVQSLRKGESNCAIIGACNIILEPELTIFFSGLNGLSVDSRCKPFANEANGFIRSEGCAVIVLKRLSDAQSAGDNILAVIKGSAVNQDGHSNGFTAPDVNAQTRLLNRSLSEAGISPDQIDFIEAHGTGTKIGDPIEMEAITNVFSSSKSKENPLLVGSVKSNMGHTECVAGLAGIIKVVLSIQNNKIPQNIHFDTPNELIDWKNIPIEVPKKNISWSNDTRNAGVSSFGVTGTNAHVIVGNYKEELKDKIPLRQDIFILPLSAKSNIALSANAKKIAKFLKESSLPLEEICANAALFRTHWSFRKLFCACTKADLIVQLEHFDSANENGVSFEEDVPITKVFVFPGQGTQWKGMALQLAQYEPTFKQTLDECTEAFSKIVSWNLWEVLQNNDYNEIDIIQPALVAVQIALAKLWQNYGVNPDIVVGHSMGEVSAAYIAGNISLDDAAKIICNRSLLMKTKSGQGEMLATDLTIEQAIKITEQISNEVAIAVVNSPNSTVLSGNSDKLNEIFIQLESEGRFAKKIKVDVASHSPQMEELLTPLKEKLAGITPVDSEIQFYSTALNKIVVGNQLGSDYWAKNLRNTVHFGKVIASILENEDVVFFEMSPHPTLVHALEENINISGQNANVIASLYKDKNELESFYSNFGQLYTHGFQIDWKLIYPNRNIAIQLPNYAWQRQRYWFDQQPKNITSFTDTNFNYLYFTEWKKIEILPNVEEKQIGILNLSKKTLPIPLQKFVSVESDELLNINVETLVVFVEESDDAVQIFLDFKEIIKKILESRKSIELVLLSLQAIPFEKEKILNTSASILWGATKSLLNEHPELNIKKIDTDNLEDLNLCLNSNLVEKELISRNGSFFSQILSKYTASKKTNIAIEGVALITGGTSGLGLETADWLAKKGFRKIGLVSRSGSNSKTIAIGDELLAKGIEIKCYACDITNNNALKELIKSIQTDLGNITTLVHAAGVLDDAPFLDLTKEKIQNVLSPKLALPLIVESIGDSLKTVLAYSSAASILGTTAQSNYAAANYYLDQYANVLRQRGIAALSINWGNIGEIGMAASDAKRGKQLEALGIGIFDKIQFNSLLDTIWGMPKAQIMAIAIDFELWSKAYPQIQYNNFFSKFIEQKQRNIKKSMDSFTNLNSATKFIKQTIKEHISTISKLPLSQIKEDVTFKSLGIDSMMAVQLKNKLQESFEMQIAVATIWSYPTVDKFAGFVIEDLQLEAKFSKPQQPAASQTAQNIEDMSLEDLMRELDEKSN